MSKSRTGKESTNINQLSLFSEATEAAQLNPDNVILESIDGRNKRHDATGIQNPGTLEALSPNDGAGIREGESPAAGGLRSAGTDGESPLRTNGRTEDGLSAGLGDRDEGVGVPSGRGRSTPAIIRSGDPRPAPTLARDFRLTSAHGIGAGGLKEKAHANLAAIRTLKSIDAANRDATDEERNLLVKYAGWGALPNVFEANPPREWRAIASELRELLSAEEYASARASTPNA